VYEKTSPRSDLSWKPTGRILKTVGLKWIPIGKLFDSCMSKVESKPTHGSNVDISKIHVCKQTLDLSASTSINVQKKQSINLSADQASILNVKERYLNTSVQASYLNVKEVPKADMIVMTSMIELESLFGPLFDEYFNRENQVVSKSFVVTTADAFDRHQQQPDSILSTSTLATTMTSDGNFDFGTESGKQDTSSRSGIDTDTDDADIRPVYDKEPIWLRVDQYPKQCQVKNLMLD
nr:hypothetical protein [Tanacetum cinerariifolium]